jgi:hypothetical protein
MFFLQIVVAILLTLGIFGNLEASNRSLTTDDILKLALDAQERIDRTDDPECRAAQRLVFTPSGPIGDRILATTSAAVFAIATNRVLELNWKTTKDCPLGYTQLFRPPREKNLLRAFLWDHDDTALLPNVVKRRETTCVLDMDTDDVPQTAIFQDRQLFEELRNECHVLFVHASTDFSYLVTGSPLNLMNGVTGKFPSLRQQILNKAFQPKEKVLSHAKSFMESTFGGDRWLSVIARSLFVNEEEVQRLTSCSNSLLEDEVVHRVFFSTDSDSLRQASIAVRREKNKFVDAQLSSVEDLSVNSSVETTLFDWYVSGHATICLISSEDTSAFTASSILSAGKCLLLPLGTDHSSGMECKIPDPPIDKDAFFNIFEFQVSTKRQLTSIHSIKREKTDVDEQCFERYVYQTENPIHEFWR